MRVISGTCKGRRLTPIQGQKIRPTADRTKESLFNILGSKVRQSNILDLFAGTGALGIEALSRGAEQATFIDLHTNVIHENLRLCRLEKKAAVICRDLTKTSSLFIPDGSKFDLVFMDPPYGKKYVGQVLDNNSFVHLLKDDSIIIAEHSQKERPLASSEKFEIYRQKKHSKTLLSFIRKNIS